MDIKNSINLREKTLVICQPYAKFTNVFFHRCFLQYSIWYGLDTSLHSHVSKIPFVHGVKLYMYRVLFKSVHLWMANLLLCTYIHSWVLTRQGSYSRNMWWVKTFSSRVKLISICIIIQHKFANCDICETICENLTQWYTYNSHYKT